MQNSDYNVLIVDEDTELCRCLSEAFEASHFTVYTCTNAPSSLTHIEQSPPDIIVTDLAVGWGGNSTLLSLLGERYPSLPVIVTTELASIDGVIGALRLGAIDYFIKPINDIGALIKSVSQVLERGRALLRTNQQYCAELEDTNEQLRLHIDELEQDQRAGHFVQQSMLPMSPFVARDYRCAHKVIPALFLSGDCIDYALLDKRYYAFYIADVSGHGSAPAFVTIWLKNLVAQLVRLRQLLTNFNSISNTLHEVMTVINDELIAMRLNNHITMVLGIIDTKTHELFYIVAGHLPLPIIVSKGQSYYLKGQGKPLGLFVDNEWEVNHEKLDDNFSLVAFSDGILEVLSGNDLLAKEKTLLESLSQIDGSIESIMEHLHVSTVEGRAPDDIAILSISRGITDIEPQ